MKCSSKKILVALVGILLFFPTHVLTQETLQPTQQDLIKEGEKLFFEETFDGNGRTCGTCHPRENNFTIDPAWIATLPPNDPLFVSEFVPGLEDLENDRLLREFGLILENVDGMEDATVKFVMRGVPHTLALSTSTKSGRGEPPMDQTGWSGDGAPNQGRLKDFLIGAIIQHYPKSLDRDEGFDFRLPTEEELTAMEAFLLSIGRQQDINLSTLNLKGERAREGLRLFVREDTNNGTLPAGKCNLCHLNAGATPAISPGVNQNFNIGSEEMDHPARHPVFMPRDGGFGKNFNPETDDFGDGTFKTSPLVEVADTAPFYHHNAIDNLFDAINFYNKEEFAHSPSAQFLASLDSGGIAIKLEERDVKAIEAFLRVINALENIREAMALQLKFKQAQNVTEAQALLSAASAELGDAIQVLEEDHLHPEAVGKLKGALVHTEKASHIRPDKAKNTHLNRALEGEKKARSDMVRE